MADAEFLTTVPIFSNLNPEQLRPLTGKLHRRRYQRGEVVFHQDDPADRLHIIVQGRVRISIASEDGREKDIALLQPGECFGEMALLDGSPRSATASAMEALETLTLFREDFLEFLDQHPEAAADTTSLLTRRLRNVNQMLGDLAFLDVPTRVAKQLLEMAETSAGDAEWQSPLEVSVGQEELARLVGASRETVSRVLNGYRRQGILLTSHRRIIIKDRPALERMALV
jgi:CRP-like cAMP-binding protein